MHGHFDHQLNFSSNDFGLIWEKPGSTFLVNRNLEVRSLTNADLQNALKALPFDYRRHGLSGLQKYHRDEGIPGTVLK